MAQYIQKPGTSEVVTLESQGFGSLQDAANQGWSPVAAPAATPTATPTVAPTTTPTAAPVMSTADISTPAPPPSTQATYVSVDAQGNVVSGSRKASDVSATQPGQIMEHKIPNVEALHSGDYIVTHKEGINYYGVLRTDIDRYMKGAAAPATTSEAMTGDVLPKLSPEQQQVQDQLNILGQSSQGIIDRMAENQKEVSALQEAVRRYRALMDQYGLYNAATSLANTEEAIAVKDEHRESEEALEAHVKDKSLPMSYFNKRLNNLITDTNKRLSTIQDAQSLQAARDAFRQTTDAIQYNLLAGQLSDAQQLSSMLAQQLYQNQNLQLNYLQLNNQINQFEYKKMRDSIEDDRYNMAQLGMVFVPPENLMAARLKYGADNIVTDPITGKSWVVNPKANEIAFTQTINGNLIGFNNMGEKVKDFGRASNYSFAQNPDGSWTITDPATGQITNTNPEKTTFSFGSGTITAYGSPAWEHGLDFVLDGGKGAPVPSPIDGEVIFAGANGGFGNQIKIRTEQGEELWISHLDSFNVKVGDTIEAGMIIGAQGNTGTVMGMNGQKYSPEELAAGKGTHLDLTIRKADGSFYTPKEVAELLGYQEQKYDDHWIVKEYGLDPAIMAKMKKDEVGISDGDIIEAIGVVEGRIQPMTARERSAVANKPKLRALELMGYDMVKAEADYLAMIGVVRNMTGEKVMSLRRSLSNLEGGVQQARKFYEAWQETNLPSGFSAYNRVALYAAAELPGEAGVAARVLISHIEDMNADLAVVYRGGGQATDDALAQARKSLNSNWNPEQFYANLDLIAENLVIRRNSINHAINEVLTLNIYGDKVQFGGAGDVSIVELDSQTYTLPSGITYEIIK